MSVRRDKSAREANRPAMGAHSFDGARSAAQISIRSPNAVNGCAQWSAIPSRSFHSIDRSIVRSEGEER